MVPIRIESWGGGGLPNWNTYNNGSNPSPIYPKVENNVQSYVLNTSQGELLFSHVMVD